MCRAGQAMLQGRLHKSTGRFVGLTGQGRRHRIGVEGWGCESAQLRTWVLAAVAVTADFNMV